MPNNWKIKYIYWNFFVVNHDGRAEESSVIPQATTIIKIDRSQFSAEYTIYIIHVCMHYTEKEFELPRFLNSLVWTEHIL